MKPASFYLDGATSLPIFPRARQAVVEALDIAGATSSVHAEGRRSLECLEKARGHVARLLGAPEPAAVVFTSGGAESAHLGLQGVVRALRSSGRTSFRIALSTVEHPSVVQAAAAVADGGVVLDPIPVDAFGKVTPETLRSVLCPDTALVVIGQTSQDLGTVQPLATLVSVAHENGSLFYADATASAGWVPVDYGAMGVDLVGITGHRMGGPKGVGALLVRPGTPFEPPVTGAGQERGWRAGTENIPGIAGLGAAVEEWLERGPEIRRQAAVRTLRLLTALAARVEHVQLNGPWPGPDRLPHHLSVAFEGVDGEALVRRLDLKGLAVGAATGCRVRDLKVPASHRAIGLDPALSLSTLLMGLPPGWTEEETDRAVSLIGEGVDWLRNLSPGWKRLVANNGPFLTPARLPVPG